MHETISEVAPPRMQRIHKDIVGLTGVTHLASLHACQTSVVQRAGCLPVQYLQHNIAQLVFRVVLEGGRHGLQQAQEWNHEVPQENPILLSVHQLDALSDFRHSCELLLHSWSLQANTGESGTAGSASRVFGAFLADVPNNILLSY